MTVEWLAEPGYQKVRDVFDKLFKSGRGTGAALSIWKELGEEVVTASRRLRPDAVETRAWTADTLVHTLLHLEAVRVRSSLHRGSRRSAHPRRAGGEEYWKEYAANGKAGHDVAAHCSPAGPGCQHSPPEAADLDLLDDDGLRRSLAEATPLYSAGTTTAGARRTFGHLIDGCSAPPPDGHSAIPTPRMSVPHWGWTAGSESPTARSHGWPTSSSSSREVPSSSSRSLPSYDDMFPRRPSGLLDLTNSTPRSGAQSVFWAIDLHTSATTPRRVLQRADEPRAPCARCSASSSTRSSSPRRRAGSTRRSASP